jgi:hypothetical protein
VRIYRCLLLSAVLALLASCAAGTETGVQPTTTTTAATEATSATTTSAVPTTTTSAPLADFTLVVLPDSQVYSALYPEIFAAQARWIVDQQSSRNIVFVSHTGDVVDGAGESYQWDNAEAAMSLLDGEVPYGIAAGNHDLTDGGAAFDSHFGVGRFEGRPWYGGHYLSDNLNSWQTLEVSGLQFLVLHLAWSPSSEILAWAKGVIDSHPGRRVILSTHEFLSKGGIRTSVGDEIWGGLVMDTCSIFLVISGHIHAVAERSNDNSCGDPVEQVLQDYQDLNQGGEGFLRVFTFRPSRGLVEVEAISPIGSKPPLGSEPFTFPFDAVLPGH